MVSASGAANPAPALNTSTSTGPQSLFDRREDLVDGAGVGDVGGHHQRLARQGRSHLLQRGQVPAQQRHPVTVRGQRRGHRRADPAAGAGDQADPAGHRYCPVQRGGRRSLNAAWNSAWSSVVISSAWVIASSSIALASDMSSSRVISALVWA